MTALSGELATSRMFLAGIELSTDANMNSSPIPFDLDGSHVIVSLKETLSEVVDVGLKTSVTRIHPAHILGLLLLTPLILTYVFTFIKATIFHNWGGNGNKPRTVPYALPWLGNFPEFMFNSKRYQMALQKAYGGIPIKLAMLDRLLYFVPHGESMRSLFRDSQHTVPAPCLLTALTIFFGLPETDALKFKKQNLQKPDPKHTAGFRGSDASRHVMELHRDDFKIFLQGANLSAIMAKVDELFAASITSDTNIIDNRWIEVPDLHDFMASRMFEAITRTFWGEELLDECPDLYQHFWEFYEALPLLILKVPRWLNPRIWAARDRILDDLIAWRQRIAPRSDVGFDTENMDVFDPVWGTAMSRRLSKVYEDIGLSERGVAAAMLSFFSVVFSNTVPSTLWTIFNIIQSTNVSQRIVAEMEPCFESNSRLFSMSELCSGPLLNSAWRETLRLRQLGPVARVPRKPNYLLSGKWSIRPRTPILAVSWLAGRDETFWNTGVTLPNGQQEHPIESFWAERFLTYPDDVTSGPIRKPGTYTTAKLIDVRAKERTSEDDKHAKLTLAGLSGHFFPFGGGAYRCPGENFAKQLNMSTVGLMLRMLNIELRDPAGAKEVQSFYAQYPLGDHRFDRKVPVRVRKRADVEY